MWFPLVYSPYKDVIDNGDISFFFNKNYNEDVKNIANADEILKLIDKVKIPISTMDKVNQGHCADYIQKLSKLSTVYTQI